MKATSKANAQFDTVLFEVSANLSRFVRASEEEIREVYAEAASRAKRKVISEIVLNAGLGLGIVVAVWLVIARQIGARLAQLAGNVRRLTFGDLAPFAKDDGSDEQVRVDAGMGASGQMLWPGAAVNGDGVAVAWPGCT